MRDLIKNLHKQIIDKEPFQGYGINVVTILEEVFQMEIDINFEIYKRSGEMPWVRESELNILDIYDITSIKHAINLKGYQLIIKDILNNPDFNQAEIKGLEIDKLDVGKLYNGKFIIKPDIKNDKRILECKELK